MRLIIGSAFRTLRSPINRSSGSVKGFLALLIIVIVLFFLFYVSDFGITLAKLFQKLANGSKLWIQPNLRTAPGDKSMKIGPRPGFAFENMNTSIQADLKPTTTAVDEGRRSTSNVLTKSSSSLTSNRTTVKTTTPIPIRLSKIHYNKPGKSHPKAVPKVSYFEKYKSVKLVAKRNKKTVVPGKTHNKIKNIAKKKSKFNSKTIFRDGHLMKLDQNDSKLVAFIRQHFLTPPSKLPYKLLNTKSVADKANNEEAEWEIVLGLLDNKKNGFFVECGASDYEFKSNTLALELDHGWSGLLVEPDPINLPELYEKHRKAWIANICLSGETFPQMITMRRWNKTMSRIAQSGERTSLGQNRFNASCLPLFSILSAIGTTQVDFFRLDVGMIGLDILKTLPFDSVSIKVLAVGMSEALKNIGIPFMDSKGYVCLQRIRGPMPRVNDYIFIQRTLYKKSMGQNCYANVKSPKN